eukprot:4810423-Amphidinium_carterae.1
MAQAPRRTAKVHFVASTTQFNCSISMSESRTTLPNGARSLEVRACFVPDSHHTWSRCRQSIVRLKGLLSGVGVRCEVSC